MSPQPATFEIQLEKLTYGGDAMGRLEDGRAVFVPFGLPGERVRVRLIEERRGFARGEILQILEPASNRAQPQCKHFGECGGCHYQHLPYEKQIQAKTEILTDQLKRIGKIENPPVQPMVPCPKPWYYRNHVQFSLTEDGKLGFVSSPLFVEEKQEARERVIAITECHLPESPINDFWRQLEFEADTGIERVSLRAGQEGDLMLVLESDSPRPPELEIEAEISVVHVYQGNTVVLAGNDYIILRVLERDFKVSAPSFFQVNTVMAEKMVNHLLAHLPVPSSATLLDLYCGVGLFSAFFAPKCKRVIGVESSPSACEDFSFNLDEFENVELYEGTAEEVLPGLVGQIAESPYVVVDPPRAGIERHALDALMQLKPHAIAYVSCDPATLARDARRIIENGYQLKQVTPFDLFPQTYHIESISLFQP
ncbi:MAG TPA: class I SAM-dependent RNA methyltransferase [Anaerolineales bacterium]|nr:class I SAM-dependent RNA methyltransferase [Anaerolineales bacterium]